MHINNKLKASSLVNTVFTCVIIAAFIGCLVLLRHYTLLINSKIELQNELINRNNSVFFYYLNNLETSNQSSDELFNDDIKSYVQKKEWGFYSILNTKTIFKGDTISKTALIGKKRDPKKNIALYVTNYDKQIKLSGNCKITGDIKIPNGKTGLAFINGKKGNNIKITGEQQKSKDKLPKIKHTPTTNPALYKTITPNDYKNSITNSFNKETLTLKLNGDAQLENITVKGNVIINSNNEITIHPSCILNDILIIAPSVNVKKGFKGNIQILAKERVTLEENVSLTYPSSIYIKNDETPASVIINSKAKIAGGIIINGNTYNGSLNRELIINEEATIIGNVYCYGKTQLQGTIIGCIYTDRLFLKTSSSKYENTLLNVDIKKNSLPLNFIELPLFESNTNYGVIKTF